ncbi:hypothetical protein BDR26DRAFT_918568 [Obelidium mucronatum]|nr:hypothetical protein BDR26DRAFT_918568 [Obelidium mucronatum]
MTLHADHLCRLDRKPGGLATSSIPTPLSSMLSRPAAGSQQQHPIPLPSKAVACVPCKKLRKSCDLAKPSCSRCIRRGTSCIYTFVAIAPAPGASSMDLYTDLSDLGKRPTPCNECRLRRKRCSLGNPCTRCFDKGIECVYHRRLLSTRLPNDLLIEQASSTEPTTYANSEASGLSRNSSEDSRMNGRRLAPLRLDLDIVRQSDMSLSSPQNSTSTEASTASFLDQLMLSFDLAIEDEDEQSVTDPLLSATTEEDFALVSNFIQGFVYRYRSSFYILLPMSILANFYTEAPAVRLSLCALAAHMTPNMKSSIGFGYYIRLRALLSSTDVPSIKTLQALFFCGLYAMLSCKVSAAFQLFSKAEIMLYALRLEVDPDDSPWLHMQQLSETEKEERRRTFWVVGVIIKITNLSHGRTDSYPAVVTVKPIQYQLETSTQTAPVVYLYHLLEIISSIIVHASSTSIQLAFTETSEFITLRNRLDIWHSSLPTILHINIGDDIILKVAGPETSCRTILNLFYHGAVCQLHRPHLYLAERIAFDETAAAAAAVGVVASCSVSDEDEDDDGQVVAQQLLVSNAVKSSFQHAYHISRLATGLANVFSKDGGTRNCEMFFHSYLPLFEAAIVLWFICCRAKPSWVEMLDSNNELASFSKKQSFREAVQEGYLAIVGVLKVFADKLDTDGVVKLEPQEEGVEDDTPIAEDLRSSSDRVNIIRPLVELLESVLYPAFHETNQTCININLPDDDDERLLVFLRIPFLREAKHNNLFKRGNAGGPGGHPVRENESVLASPEQPKKGNLFSQVKAAFNVGNAGGSSRPRPPPPVTLASSHVSAAPVAAGLHAANVSTGTALAGGQLAAAAVRSENTNIASGANTARDQIVSDTVAMATSRGRNNGNDAFASLGRVVATLATALSLGPVRALAAADIALKGVRAAAAFADECFAASGAAFRALAAPLQTSIHSLTNQIAHNIDDSAENIHTLVPYIDGVCANCHIGPVRHTIEMQMSGVSAYLSNPNAVSQLEHTFIVDQRDRLDRDNDLVKDATLDPTEYEDLENDT